jgi:hypothetical protein
MPQWGTAQWNQAQWNQAPWDQAPRPVTGPLPGRVSAPLSLRYTPIISTGPQGPVAPPHEFQPERAVPRDRQDSPDEEDVSLRQLAASMPRTPAEHDGTSLIREVIRTMRTRNLMTGLLIPITVAIAVGVAVVVAAGANSGSGLPPSQLSAGFPPARVASADFTGTPALAGRGLSTQLTRVAAVGADIVAVGAQTGGRIGRARFLFSGDAGHTWRLASVRAADGGAQPSGQAPALVAGGPAGWVAVGQAATFTSPDGQAWVARAALPQQPGDIVSALITAGTGFLAAGQNVPGGNQAATPVVWLSATGTSWQRIGAAQLGLPVPAGTRVLGITHAAANGTVIVLSGMVQSPAGQASAAWRSANGGGSWTAVTIPQVTGAAVTIAGVAPLRNGFMAVRPAAVNGAMGALVYTSPDGAAWTSSARIATANGAAFTIGQVTGGPGGAVIEGSAEGLLIAFLSADGATWLGTDPIGSQSAEQVGGVALSSAMQAVIAGSSAGAGGVASASQPVLTLIGAKGGPDQVVASAIPGVTGPEIAVNAIAASGATQVAAGSADGFPAVWSSQNGGSTWARGTPATPSAFARAGIQQITGVAHGPAGWVAVGGPDLSGGATPAPGHPVVVVSADGPNSAPRAWTAEDGRSVFGAHDLVTSAVAAASGGSAGSEYVIVGWQSAGGHSTPMAWYSAGLAGWRPAIVSAAGGNSQLAAVTATSSGFVSVGSSGTRPAAWLSGNGRAWRQVTLAAPAGAVSASLGFVAANGGAIAAAGTEVTAAGAQVPFAAISADGGSTWTEGPLPAPGTAPPLTITALTAAGPGFTATGTFGAPGNQDVVIWSHEPAEGGNAATGTWTASAPDGYGLSGTGVQAITALAVAGATLTGAGFTATAAGEEPTIWQSPIRG